MHTTCRQSIALTKKCSWAETKERIISLNPELYRIIEEINPSDDLPLYIISYPYGSSVLSNGRFRLPNDQGEVVPLNHSSIHPDIQEDLSYNLEANPISLNLKGSCELFFPHQDHPMSIGLYKAGAILGTWRILSLDNASSHHPYYRWTLTAGCRSIFMLPKISDTSSHNKLKLIYQLHTEKPTHLDDHFFTFRELANHPDFTEQWQLDMLFFSRQWIHEILHNPKWAKLYHYMLLTTWKAADYYRNKPIWDNIFALIKHMVAPKSDPFLTDSTRNILAICTGDYPGHAPAVDSELAPIQGLQHCYEEVYRLKAYAPVLMVPTYFEPHKNTRPVYYSLNYTSSFEHLSQPPAKRSTLFELSELKYLIDKYKETILSDQLNLNNTAFHKISQNTRLAYFHSEEREHQNIQSSTFIPIADPSFQKINPHNLQPYAFPKNNTFTRGCVRIEGVEGG